MRWCVLMDAENTYQAQRPCPPPISAQQSGSAIVPYVQCDHEDAYLAAALAWVDGILAVHGRFGRGRLHGWECAVCGWMAASPSSDNASRRASDGHPEAALARKLLNRFWRW